MRKNSYQTKQQAAIFKICESFGEDYFTAAHVISCLEAEGVHLGMATVYRQLKNLESKGFLSSTHLAGSDSRSYRFLSPSPESAFYMQCEDCGKVIHFDCAEIQKVYSHLEADHNFSINPRKTIFYGQCGCNKSKL
ncbi:Fur family transcriptional regulator, ferric uptake regulator [Peptostreptococcaceae bacterium pGA-8]|nr:Fur family transcriptional regulator, ferric uptake regulator [Peptostreptococcaceae bacterium pGA-8]